MFKWLREWWARNRNGGYSDNTAFLEEVRKENQDPPDPAIESISEKQTITEEERLVAAKVSYFTVQGDPDGTVYLDITSAQQDEQSVRDLAKIIASTFNIKVQAQTIGIIRENLIQLERKDLLETFMKALIHASAESGVSNSLGSVVGKEKPCVSPTDIIK